MVVFTIIAYLIGNIKYKQIMIKRFDDKNELLKSYRELLNIYSRMKEFVMVMLNENMEICTAWALETPQELKSVAELALDRYENGESFFIDPSIKMINLFGSIVYKEIIDEGKKLEVIPDSYIDPDLTDLAISETVDETASETVSTV